MPSSSLRLRDFQRRTSVTVSIGVAEGRAPGGRSPEDLLRLADAALYDAKLTGRNRVGYV